MEEAVDYGAGDGNRNIILFERVVNMLWMRFVVFSPTLSEVLG